MATQQNLQLLLTKGLLSSLWDSNSKTLKNNININNGQMYIGLDESTGRAMLFIDNNNKRHVFTADVAWGDLRNIPSDLVYEETLQNNITTLNNTISTKVEKNGDTMTGPLSIAQDNSTAGILKKVILDYNEQTESLDFSFT